LRASVLSAATAALREEQDVWERLWHSRSLRLGWAAALVLLIGSHLAITPLTRKGVEPAAADTVFSMGSLDSELQEIVRLPRIDQAALIGLP
jgi:hypothetical protein